MSTVVMATTTNISIQKKGKGNDNASEKRYTATSVEKH